MYIYIHTYTCTHEHKTKSHMDPINPSGVNFSLMENEGENTGVKITLSDYMTKFHNQTTLAAFCQPFDLDSAGWNVFIFNDPDRITYPEDWPPQPLYTPTAESPICFQITALSACSTFRRSATMSIYTLKEVLISHHTIEPTDEYPRTILTMTRDYPSYVDEKGALTFYVILETLSRTEDDTYFGPSDKNIKGDTDSY